MRPKQTNSPTDRQRQKRQTEEGGARGENEVTETDRQTDQLVRQTERQRQKKAERKEGAK